MLISIGHFSKICSVSVKTLRHYDSIGLLKPASVDEFTGYRYYDEKQLSDMLVINRLKRYGFPLADIKELITVSSKNEFLNELRKQAVNIETDIDHKRMLLNELNGIIRSYERTGKIMDYKNNYNVTTTNTQPMTVLSSRQKMSVEDFGKYYGILFAKIAREGITTTGKALAVYHDEEFDEKCSDIEVAIEILDKDKATRVIDGGLCAATVHKGSYANLSEAYAAVVEWISSNGYKIIAPPYEIYRKSYVDNIPVEEWETDIYFPVEKG